MAYHHSNMELRPIIIGITFILLAGCSSSQPADTSRPTIFSDNTDTFSIEIPRDAVNKYVRNDKSTAFTPYAAPTTDYQPLDYLIEIYPSESVSTPSSCNPLLTGISKTTHLANANGNTEWGYIDFWDRYPGNDYPADVPLPPCRPTNNDGSSYALCSEKDGKTVLICVSQITDNPALAKEIFETFRWTK